MTQRYAHLSDEAFQRAWSLAGSLIEEAAKNDDRGGKKGKKTKIGA